MIESASVFIFVLAGIATIIFGWAFGIWVVNELSNISMRQIVISMKIDNLHEKLKSADALPTEDAP